MTDADKVMSAHYFVSDPADIQIRIWINPKNRNQILDHFVRDFGLGGGLRSLSTV